MPAQHDGNDVSFISIGLQSDIFQNIRIKKNLTKEDLKLIRKYNLFMENILFYFDFKW